MTQLILANIGSFPRVGEDKDHQRYRRGYGHFERKEISAHGFRDVVQSVIQEIIRDQETCFLDEVTDGLVTWQDPISHFCTNLTGIERTGLTRYFGTNFYFRRPVIAARPRFNGPLIVNEFLFAKSVTSKTVRAVLTGPLTLATHTGATAKNLTKLSSRVDLFTEVIGEEVRALAAAGASVIQIDEPSLAGPGADFKLAKKSLERICEKKGAAKIVLALYFFPLARLWNALQSLPVDGLQLDFTKDGEQLFQNMLAKPGSKEIGFGLLDALTTKLEPTARVGDILRRWLDVTPAARVRVTPSAGLELLPRGSALAKLGLLNSLRAQFQSSPQPLAANE